MRRSCWAARLKPKIDATDDCWIWRGSTSTVGYGQFHVWGRLVTAHRFVYELYVGPIPEGLVLDHLCRNRQCVNPAHLEPVTHRINILRGEGAGARNAAKEECPRGHPLTPENVRPSPRGFRRCSTCYPKGHHLAPQFQPGSTDASKGCPGAA